MGLVDWVSTPSRFYSSRKAIGWSMLSETENEATTLVAGTTSEADEFHQSPL